MSRPDFPTAVLEYAAHFKNPIGKRLDENEPLLYALPDSRAESRSRQASMGRKCRASRLWDHERDRFLLEMPLC